MANEYEATMAREREERQAGIDRARRSSYALADLAAPGGRSKYAILKHKGHSGTGLAGQGAAGLVWFSSWGILKAFPATAAGCNQARVILADLRRLEDTEPGWAAMLDAELDLVERKR